MAQKLFSAKQIRAWDASTIAKGVSSISLMERAGKELCDLIVSSTTFLDRIAVFAGVGNNGGDATVVARLLIERGYRFVDVYLVQPEALTISPDCQINSERLDESTVIRDVTQIPSLHTLNAYDRIIDGLFGSGLSRPLAGIWSEIVLRINQSSTPVISIDIPSGAHVDIYEKGNVVVNSDEVLTLQIPKRVFMYPESGLFMKGFEVLDIGLDPDFHENEACKRLYLQAEDAILIERDKFSHKGKYGHGLLIAGSRGMYGAAQLAAQSCLRSGVGLLTVHSAAEAMSILQTTTPAAMFSCDRNVKLISAVPDLSRATTIACGPGLGKEKATISFLDEFLEGVALPLILDADALNIIAQENWQERIPKGTIISPHPKEFERLFGKTKDSSAAIQLQQEKSKELGIIIIRKGAHTSIAFPDGRLYFNSTGNPYMAMGGMGDLLTGVLLGLRAQGLSAEQAALSGVFHHGSAGDKALGLRSGRIITCLDVIDAFAF